MDLHVFAIDSPYNKAFVEFINRNFNTAPHFFIVMREKAAVKFTLPDQKNIIYLPASDVSQYRPFYELFNQARRIFAHSLFEPALSVYAAYPGRKKIMVIPWGSDLAPFIFRSEADRLDGPTRRFFHGAAPPMAAVTFDQMAAEWETWRKMNLVMSKTSHILHFINFSQQVLNRVFKQNIPTLAFQYFNPVNFKLLERDDLPANPDYHFKKRFNRVIQLNHSGNPANNHISLIEKLAEAGRDDFCVVAPLSYGPPKAIEAIAKYGREKLGERFFPILEFLPPDQYAALMRQLDALLVNTVYSGAMANMTAMLHLGRKVLLSSRNISTHAAFKAYDITLPPINPDDRSDAWIESIFEAPDEEASEHNSRQMRAMVGEERLAAMYASLLEKTEPA
jgi:hypothetical protein